MPNFTCPMCSDGELEKVTGDYKTAFLDDSGDERELVVRNLTWDQCSNCGEVFLDDEATQRIEAVRLQAMRRLSPAEIKRFRESLQRTQKEMAMLLGLGEKTYSRWESGAYIQNAASDRYLRLLMINRGNIAILEKLAESASEGPPQPSDISTPHPDFRYLMQSDVLLDTEAYFTEMLLTGTAFFVSNPTPGEC